MSRTTSFRIEPRQVAATDVAAALERLGAPLQHREQELAMRSGVTAHDLERSADMIGELLAAGIDAHRLQETWTSAALQDVTSSGLTQALPALKAARIAYDHLDDGNSTQVAEAAQLLRDGLVGTAALVRDGHHNLAAFILADSVDAAGWTVHDAVPSEHVPTLVSGERVSTLEGIRGHARVLVGIVDDEVSIDISGLADSSCDQLLEEIADQGRSRGLDMTDGRAVDHRAADGGSLTTAAAAHHEATLARGLHVALTEALRVPGGQPGPGRAANAVAADDARRRAAARRAARLNARRART